MQHAGDRVVEAARRTLAERGARISEVWFADPPGRHGLIARWEGVADLGAARSHVTEQPGGAWERVGEEFVRRWPWLEDEDGEELGPSEKIEARGKVFYGFDGRWFATEPPATGRHPQGPTWIVEALAGTVRADDGGGEYFRVLVEGPTRARAFVRIGDDGLLRRVTWHRLERTRRPPSSRLWHTLELQDFGAPVEVPTPVVTPMPTSDEPFWHVVGEIVLELYRRRRAWRATHSR